MIFFFSVLGKRTSSRARDLFIASTILALYVVSVASVLLPVESTAQVALVGTTQMDSSTTAYWLSQRLTAISSPRLGTMSEGASRAHLVGRFTLSSSRQIVQVQRIGTAGLLFSTVNTRGQTVTRTLQLPRSIPEQVKILTGFDVSKNGLHDLVVVQEEGNRLRWTVVADPLLPSARVAYTFRLGAASDKVEWFYGANNSLSFVAVSHHPDSSLVRLKVYNSSTRRIQTVASTLPGKINSITPFRLTRSRKCDLGIGIVAPDLRSVFLPSRSRSAIRIALPSQQCNGAQLVTALSTAGTLSIVELCGGNSFVAARQVNSITNSPKVSFSSGSFSFAMGGVRRGDFAELGSNSVLSLPAQLPIVGNLPSTPVDAITPTPIPSPTPTPSSTATPPSDDDDTGGSPAPAPQPTLTPTPTATPNQTPLPVATLLKDINDSTTANDDGYTKHFLTLASGKVIFVAMNPEPGEELWVSDGTESGTFVLDNIAPNSSSFAGLDVKPILSADGALAYYSCRSESSGRGLCVTDGTLAGTRRLGGAFASASSAIACGPGVFFTGTTDDRGHSLLYADTSTGVVNLKPTSEMGGTIVPLVGSGKHCAGNRILFGVYNGTTGRELWTSNGTSDGTALVHDLNTISGASGLISPLGTIGSKFIFSGTSSTYTGQELWAYDPDASDCAAFAADTASCVIPSNGLGRLGMLADILPGTTTSGILTSASASVGGRVFFQGINSSGNRELWSTDGTASGTRVVYDYPGTTTAPSVTMSRSSGTSGEVYFTAHRGASAGNYGTEPHVFVLNPGRECSSFGADFVPSTDGAGCVGMIADLNPGGNTTATFYQATPEGLFFRSVSSTTSHLFWNLTSTPPFAYTSNTPADSGATPVLDGILFSTFGTPPAPVVGGKRELWFSNGYETRLVKEINPSAGSVGPNHYSSSSAVLGAKRYFTAWNQSIGAELWATDGTSAGTVLVKNISPGVAGSGVSSFAVLDGVLYFIANDGIYDSELWAYDPSATDCTRFDPSTVYGSSCSTENSSLVPGRIGIVKNINSAGSASINSLTVLDSAIYFSAKSGPNYHPWRSGGTASTTSVVHSSTVGTVSPVNRFGRAGNKILFSGAISALSDLYAFIPGAQSNDSECVAAHGLDYRRATVDGCYAHLFDFAGSSPDIQFLGSTNDGLKAFFQATTPSVGTELYVTDGTPSGTALVKDILVGPGSALNVLLGGTPGPFGVDKFVFTAIDRYSTDGIANQQIWITDGTLSGTHPLSSSSEGFHARALYVDTVANRIFFIAGNPSTGMELWTSDGSPSGAVIVRDICPGPCNGAASGSELGATLGISPLGDGRVMLRGNNGSSGTEPVVSDGTSQGTSLFEIVPGSVGSSPLYFWALPSGSVVIYASDGSHGHEPWIARP